MPLPPYLRLELGRQLELTVAECLGWVGAVPAFMRGLSRQLEALKAEEEKAQMAGYRSHARQLHFHRWSERHEKEKRERLREEVSAKSAAEGRADGSEPAPAPEYSPFADPCEDAVAREEDAAPAWPEMMEEKPAGVPAGAWEGLFELVAIKLGLLLGAQQALPWVQDICEPRRWQRLLASRPAQDVGYPAVSLD